ncbi:hypothetical protein Tco_0755160 [Tanacetum coccineum]
MLEKERESLSIAERARLLAELIDKSKKLQAAQRYEEMFDNVYKQVTLFVPMDSVMEKERTKRVGQEVLEEPANRQKIREAFGSGEEQSTEKEKKLSKKELHKLLMIVPVEEVYVEALQVKYPIIDWEVYFEDTRRYWRINYQKLETIQKLIRPFDDKLKKFDKMTWISIGVMVKKDPVTTDPK